MLAHGTDSEGPQARAKAYKGQGPQGPRPARAKANNCPGPQGPTPTTAQGSQRPRPTTTQNSQLFQALNSENALRRRASRTDRTRTQLQRSPFSKLLHILFEGCGPAGTLGPGASCPRGTGDLFHFLHIPSFSFFLFFFVFFGGWVGRER